MAGMHVTQTGLNRALFIMLKKLGGRIVIKAHHLDQANPDDAIKIQHDPASMAFVFTLSKIKESKSISQILTPGMN